MENINSKDNLTSDIAKRMFNIGFKIEICDLIASEICKKYGLHKSSIYHIIIQLRILIQQLTAKIWSTESL